MSLCAQYGYVNADMLHGLDLPEGTDKRVFGLVLGKLKARGVLEITGYMKSKRRTCHHRPIAVYRFKKGVNYGRGVEL
jgi:hypothetical protein